MPQTTTVQKVIEVSEEGLESAPNIGEVLACAKCGGEHQVITTIVAPNGRIKLHHYICRGAVVLAGVNGKDVRGILVSHTTK